MKTIRQLRTEMGWAQLDLALRLGVGANTVSAWERGLRVPSRMHRAALVRLFSISPAELALGDTTLTPEKAEAGRPRPL